jgi:beta-lactamase superfamily II metal-dependent hydrolase
MVTVGEALNIETLAEPEGTHAENNSSVILLFDVDNECVLFTADAGMQALDRALDVLANAKCDMNRIKWVQVPHHGSRRNVGPTLLNRLLGPIQGADVQIRRAIVSASKDGAPKHPSKQVLNAFRRRGAPVWGTMSVTGALMCSHQAPRQNWSSVEKLPFYSEVED